MRLLRRRLISLTSKAPIFTLDEQIGFSLRTERLVASLSAGFGGVATLLAVIGLYGVMAYVVTRRTREMGIRIALGAMRGNVVAMIMREVLMLLDPV